MGRSSKVTSGQSKQAEAREQHTNEGERRRIGRGQEDGWLFSCPPCFCEDEKGGGGGSPRVLYAQSQSQAQANARRSHRIYRGRLEVSPTASDRVVKRGRTAGPLIAPTTT